jgi:glycosyltransferase involved in cell wall biosynthesis
MKSGPQETRVLVLIERYGQGGTEKLASMLSSSLIAFGYRVVYLCTVYDDCPNRYPTTAAEVSLRLTAPRSRLGKWVNYGRKLWRLRAIKRRLAVDVSISLLWPADWPNLLIGAEKKMTGLVINIGGNPQNARLLRHPRLVSYVYRRADRLMACNSSFAEEMHGTFNVDKARLKHVRNPIFRAAIAQNMMIPLAPALEAWFAKNDVIVGIGRLNEIKNFGALIPILAAVRKSRNARLLIIGEGPQADAIQMAAGRWALNWCEVTDGAKVADAVVCRMRFCENIHNLLRGAKAFLLPSKGEGVPLVLLEAMACGVPVIVSDCPNGGPAEVLLSGSNGPHRIRREVLRTPGGFLMPIPDLAVPETIQDWAETVRKVLDRKDEASAMGVEGQRISSNYDISEVAGQWHQEIMQIVG